MAHVMSYTRHPYERCSNLGSYLEDSQARREVALINGRVIFKGVSMSEKQFKSIEPVQLIIESERLDGRQF